MQAYVAKARLLEQRLPLGVIARRIDQPSTGGREDQVVADIPLLTGREPTAVHRHSMNPQLLDQRRRQDDGPLGRLGLGLDQQQPSAGPVIAFRTALSSAGRLPFDHLTAVLPVVALDGAAHPHHALVQVDVLPQQSQRLALPHAERERDRPARWLERGLRGLEDAAALLDRERLHLDVLDARRPRDQRRVTGQAPPAYRLVEGGPQDAMDGADGVGGVAVGLHPAVVRLEVLGLDLAHPPRPESRHDMEAHLTAVRRQGLPSRRHRQHVLEPVLEPRFEG
nr:hypothetical protein [Nocardioides antri]